ncbi:AAA family ATPase [uncultured Clostridium sp.]|jgi:DNA helicase-2/ATP-dependent DNA helicase PcrA|uniref:HelD family protein n=1 Tax=uncultured Clostridium sp. TaxID=59620 RepID=UPI002622CB4A|nr:AAA family ATPase [uncultured Clostridium sp.]
MTIGLKREDEIKYLDKTIAAIDNLLASFGVSSDRQSKDIKSDRRHFWTNFSELDEIEVQQFNQDMAMQEKLYVKNRTKINTLQTQREVPYFARIDFKEDGDSFAESLYIGISSVMEDDFDFLVLDWRSPISNMFYDFEMGKAHYQTPNGEIEGEIVLNRQYNIKHGEIKFIHESNSSIHDDSLLDILSSNTSDKMKNIVSSIQKQQNEIIRNDKSKILLLQGCAGSGKTSIAMHRAAYLLYKHRKTLRADNILIFSPNEVFSDYIADVLPGLGEQNIKQTTFEGFYSSYLPSIFEYEKKHDYLEYTYSNQNDKRYQVRNDGMIFKNSKEFMLILDKFCDTLPDILPNFNDIKFDGEVIIRKNKVKETFIDRFRNVPYLNRIENLKQSIISQVETKYLKQAKKKNSSDYGYNMIDHGEDFNTYLIDEISEQVNAMFKLVNPIEIYKRLWLTIENYTNKPLDDVKSLTINSINDLMVNFEDIVPALYIRCAMEGFRDYSNIKHIIIDECQDYSPLFYSLINKTFKNASATILGDLNQRIASNTNITAKEEISSIFGEDKTEIACLTKSYRSTKNITNFAKEILRSSEAVEAVDRNGLDVQQIKSSNISNDVANIVKEITKRDLTSIAIIPKTGSVAQELYDSLKDKIENLNLIIDENSTYSRGITIIPSYIAKGLEFDAVIIPDGNSTSYSLDSERNLLYTVCTRALHELHILTESDFSNLFN